MSRSIPESLWQASFLKPNGRYDGLKFEKLAMDVLDALYGRGWRPTATTGDGSRDFEKRAANEWLWAECKAYSDRLSVYVISPTLVMAVIEQPDTVIVISRSGLNDNAVRHLAAFQGASGKKIVALDGIVLDDAILGSGVFHRYFPAALTSRSSLSGLLVQSAITPDVLREPAQTDLLAYETGNRSRRPINVVRYSLVRIDLALRNLSALRAGTVRLEIVKETVDPGLRLVSFGGSKRVQALSIQVPAGGIIRTSLIIQPRQSTDRVSLPEITVTGEGTQKRIQTGQVHVSHLYQIEMVGREHRRILKRAGTFIRGRRRPVIVSTEGASGSGKSRLILEIAKVGLEEGFRCHFYNPEFEDAKAAENILRDLVADISELPRLGRFENKADLSKATAKSSTVGRALYDSTFDLWEHVHEVATAVISLLARKPTLLVIDNLQFTDERFIEFIEALIIGLEHSGNEKIVLVISINTDFMPSGGKVDELLMKLRARSQNPIESANVFHSQLKDFGIEDVADFVGAALSGRASSGVAASMFEKTLDLLVRKVEPKPLNLWQSLMYLADEGVLSLADDRLTVAGDELLLSRLETIPAGLNDLLELRWARIRKNEAKHGISESELESTVRALYFLGSDTRDRLLAAGAREGAIERLLRVGIFENQPGGLVQFFHSQVFAFFRGRFSHVNKRTALGLKRRFQNLQLVGSKFQQYFIVSHFAANVSSPLLVNTVRRFQESGLTIDYGRQFTELLLSHLTASGRSLSATTLTGVTLISDWQQRLESLQSGQRTLRSFLTKRVLTTSRRVAPGPPLFEFYTATINASLAVYEDSEALEVITLALHDLRLSQFPNSASQNSALASILNRKAATLKNFGRIDEALDAGFEALKKFERVHNYSMVVETLFDLGSVSIGLPDRYQANELFQKGCELFERHRSEMREPAPCRYFYVAGRLAIQNHDFATALELCTRGKHHAERQGISFWGIRLVLLEAVARLLAARNRTDLRTVNALLINARDWSNITHAERSRLALSYMDGKLFVKLGERARAGESFSETVRVVARKLKTPEQVAWKSSLLFDIAATSRRHNLPLEESAIALLKNTVVKDKMVEILTMPENLFIAFERRRAKQAAFFYKNQIIELA